ncbi:MAG: CDP-diacylglycerol--serine O-phosphatidyltransferase [Candidatus Kapaibacterium sp.]
MKRRITRSIVPNLFTLVNLFAGFTAIVHIANGDFMKATIFIIIGAVFDMLDGVMARLINSTSEFGVELDSLCDAVSFGVAPAFMLYQAHFYQYGESGILFASLPALAGVSRLARFNVELETFDDKMYFKGLPIPSGALIIISFIMFYDKGGLLPQGYEPHIFFAVSILTSLAMISRIRFDNLPRPTKKSFKQRPVVFVLFLVGLVASIATKGKFIFPFLLFYLVGSSVRHFIDWLRIRRQPEDDIDDTHEDESVPFE